MWKGMKGKSFVLVGLLFLCTTAHASRFDSADINIADGVTGQDTTIGDGIKTDHIQDGAVTSDKIAEGAINDEKISGQISSSKISSTGLDADTLDGFHAYELGADKKYSNVFVVAKQGGDFDNLLDALNTITDSSIDNPYLIKIMPGVYDSPSGNYALKDFVDIQGSGKNVTKLVLHSTIRGTDIHSTISSLSIEVQGTGNACVGGNWAVKGIDIGGTDNELTLDDVYLEVNNGVTGYLISATGVVNIFDSILKNSAGSCSAKIGIKLNPGAYNNFLTIKDSEIFGGYSSYNGDSAIVADATNASIIDVYDSTISASTWAIGAINSTNDRIDLYSNNSVFSASNMYYPTVDLKPTDKLEAVNTQFNGGLDKPDPANVKMFNCYDGNYNLLAN